MNSISVENTELSENTTDDADYFPVFLLHSHQMLHVKYLKRSPSQAALPLGKYTCSGIVPAHLNFLHLHSYKFPVKCTRWWCDVIAHLLSQPVSSLSVWEREWFVAAIWEINKCFQCLFCRSTGTGWGGTGSLNYTDNITSTMTRVHIVKFPE